MSDVLNIIFETELKATGDECMDRRTDRWRDRRMKDRYASVIYMVKQRKMIEILTLCSYQENFQNQTKITDEIPAF